MLTAHLPSGYILGRGWWRPGRYVLPAALLGAMFPDLDMLWFLLVDHGRVHHHYYWPHLPAVWVVIAAAVMAAIWRTGWRDAGLAFFAGVLLHLLLDSIAGGIAWGWPWSDHLFEMVTVPAAYSHWVISFVLHWTFLLEIAIWAWAIALWIRRDRA